MIFDNLTTNTPHATLAFGPQIADLSLARIPDLTGPFVLAQPTPRAANVTAVSLGPANSLKINEWLATPVSGADWFEVYNPGSSPVLLSGLLFSDQTSVAQKVPLSKNGEWPLYVPLYSGKGSLLSWVAFTNRVNDDFHGQLNWSKPALLTTKYYPLGFTTNENPLVGARYTAPVGTNKILQLTAATLTLNGVNLVQNYTNDLVLSLGSRVTNGGPHGLTLTFTTASGLFKGSLTPTNTKAIAFAGAVLQKGTNAAGYSLGANHSARATLQPTPDSAPHGGQ